MTSEPAAGRPTALAGIVLNCPTPRVLAEFYRQLLGWRYRAGHEATDPAGDEWLVLEAPAGPALAFQQDPTFQPSTWPDPTRPLAVHLDLRVADMAAEHDRVVSLGARALTPEPEPSEDVFRVYADPVGHLFCLTPWTP